MHAPGNRYWYLYDIAEFTFSNFSTISIYQLPNKISLLDLKFFEL